MNGDSSDDDKDGLTRGLKVWWTRGRRPRVERPKAEGDEGLGCREGCLPSHWG